MFWTWIRVLRWWIFNTLYGFSFISLLVYLFWFLWGPFLLCRQGWPHSHNHPDSTPQIQLLHVCNTIADSTLNWLYIKSPFSGNCLVHFDSRSNIRFCLYGEDIKRESEVPCPESCGVEKGFSGALAFGPPQWKAPAHGLHSFPPLVPENEPKGWLCCQQWAALPTRRLSVGIWLAAARPLFTLSSNLVFCLFDFETSALSVKSFSDLWEMWVTWRLLWSSVKSRLAAWGGQWMRARRKERSCIEMRVPWRMLALFSSSFALLFFFFCGGEQEGLSQIHFICMTLVVQTPC